MSFIWAEEDLKVRCRGIALDAARADLQGANAEKVLERAAFYEAYLLDSRIFKSSPGRTKQRASTRRGRK